jgi:hypothetical protein
MGGGTDVIHGCARKFGGDLRLVGGPGDCRRWEYHVSWNKEGPPGPPGQQGIPGEQGPPGIVPDQSCPEGQFVTGVVGGVLQCEPKTIFEQSFDIEIGCTSSGQLCEPVYQAQVDASSAATLDVRFTAGPLWCSHARMHITLDGALSYTSPLLTHDESTGWVTLGPVSSGQHTIGLQLEGVVGGCNSGTLHRWEGTLEAKLTS